MIEKLFNGLLYGILTEAKTLSGTRIILDVTDPENQLRSSISAVSSRIAHQLHDASLDNAALIDAVEKLRNAYEDSRHYGDNTPDRYFTDGRLSFPGASFSYYDFFGFAVSGYENYYRGFSSDLDLPKEISYSIACGLIGLLDVDRSVDAINRGDLLACGSTLIDAADAGHEMLSATRYRQMVKKMESEAQRRRGKMRHARRTDPIKKEVLSQWDLGVFKGNKSAAAAWAINEYVIEPETVKRWIRSHEQGERTTT